MREITITVSPRKVMQRIYTHTYYTGEARKVAGTPMRHAAGIQASEDDATQLDDHLQTAIGEIAGLLSRQLAICRCNEDIDNDSGERIVCLSFIPPQNYPRESLPQMEKIIENYVVMRTLQQWMAQHNPPEQTQPANEAEVAMQQLRGVLSLRKKPRRERNCHKRIIDI